MDMEVRTKRCLLVHAVGSFCDWDFVVKAPRRPQTLVELCRRSSSAEACLYSFWLKLVGSWNYVIHVSVPDWARTTINQIAAGQSIEKPSRRQTRIAEKHLIWLIVWRVTRLECLWYGIDMPTWKLGTSQVPSRVQNLARKMIASTLKLCIVF